MVWFAINSTAYTEPKVTADYLAENKMSDMIAMVDANGRVGHMYGARTTPHVFVIDAEGVLRYTGAFDDDPDGPRPAVARPSPTTRSPPSSRSRPARP